MKVFKSIIYYIVLLLLSYWGINHLFVSGYFPIHDNTQVERVFEMSKSLSYGMFPVRWAEDLGYGYGYPIFNFYAPLSYYFGAFLNLLGFDILLATKLMMAVGALGASFSMYLLGKTLWGRNGGIASALFYFYAPYHALDIYVRGDVAEFWAYAFVPLVFYFLVNLYKENNLKYIILGAFSYAGIILSHNLTAFMITPFLILFYLTFQLIYKKNIIFYFVLMLITGIGLSSFYTLPAIFEAKYTNVISQVGGGADFKDHFVCLSQFWDSHWGFGGSALGCTDGMSFRLGKLYILIAGAFLALFSLGFLINKLKIKNEITKHKEIYSFIIFSLLGFCLSIFLMLDFSRIIWNAVPFMEFLQYPWRFLIFASFFTSVFAGGFIWVLGKLFKKFGKEKINFCFIFALIIFLIYVSNKLFIPQTILIRDSKNFTSRDDLVWKTSKISDEYMPVIFKKPKNIIEVPSSKILNNNDLILLHEESKTGEVHLSVKAERNTLVQINIASFPGWMGFLDNKEIILKENDKGMLAEIPKGVHSLDLFFVQTPVQKLGNSISLVFLFLVFAGIIYTRMKK